MRWMPEDLADSVHVQEVLETSDDVSEVQIRGGRSMLDHLTLARRLRQIRASSQAVGHGIDDRPWHLGLWYDILGLLAIWGMLWAAWVMPCGVLE